MASISWVRSCSPRIINGAVLALNIAKPCSPSLICWVMLNQAEVNSTMLLIRISVQSSMRMLIAASRACRNFWGPLASLLLFGRCCGELTSCGSCSPTFVEALFEIGSGTFRNGIALADTAQREPFFERGGYCRQVTGPDIGAAATQCVYAAAFGRVIALRSLPFAFPVSKVADEKLQCCKP